MSQLLKIPRAERTDRPYIDVSVNGMLIQCLIDTGSNFVIFTLGRDKLLDYFPNAEIDKEHRTEIKGFGKGDTPSELFKIDKFRITGKIGRYIEFTDLLVACCDRKDLGATLILPFGIFKELNLMFVNVQGGSEVWLMHGKSTYEGKFDSTKDGLVYKVYAYAQTSENVLDDVSIQEELLEAINEVQI